MATIIIALIILLTAVWNGQVINWYISKQQRWSRGWHLIGFIIRGLLCFLTYLQTENWYWVGAMCMISWIPYNVIINLYMHKPIFYVGKTSAIDNFIRRLFSIK